MSSCAFIQMTPSSPGAIAIVQLVGDAVSILRRLTGVDDWPIGRLRLVRFDDFDEGLAVRLSDEVAQCMPHGGPRVMQRLAARLVELGARPQAPDAVDPLALYPEAADRFEALALASIARAASPRAIDLLLDQPRRWRTHPTVTDEDRARSRRLNRLIDPPIVVLAGQPNVGKSTLSNALMGRAMSIAHDMPGTTRDYTAGRIDLGGVVVQWHDTPGIRDTQDPIERRAIAISTKLMACADLLISMSDHQHAPPRLPREPDLLVVGKTDLAAAEDFASPNAQAADVISQCDDATAPSIRLSAITGEGMSALVAVVRERLVPFEDQQHPGPWLFDQRLET
jgi:tRNA modification GTPase